MHNHVAGTVLFSRHSPRAARTCARVSTKRRKARPTTGPRPRPPARRYVPGRVTSHWCGSNLHAQGTLRSFLRITQKNLRSRSPSRPSLARYSLAPAPTGLPKVCWQPSPSHRALTSRRTRCKARSPRLTLLLLLLRPPQKRSRLPGRRIPIHVRRRMPQPRNHTVCTVAGHLLYWHLWLSCQSR
jgi:hypothetical protein